MNRFLRQFLYGAIALCAVGVLVFLFVKNREFSIERQQSVAESLRDLRQQDADLDAGVLRTNVGLVGDYDPLSAAVIAMQATLAHLSANYQWEGADPALLTEVTQLVEEKTALADRFKAENAVLRNSLRYLPTVRDEVQKFLHTRQEKIALYRDLDAQVDRIFRAMLRYSLFADTGTQVQSGAWDSPRGGIESDLDTLEENLNLIQQGLPPGKEEENAQLIQDLEQVSAFVAHSRAVLRQTGLVTQRMEEIFATPLVGAIGKMSLAVQTSTQTTLAEAERQRIFLLGYAALLLLVIFYFAIRLAVSYRQVSVANRRLQVANETLEQRVQERTEDLEHALLDLKQSESQLVQSEKMASLGQMVAGVAHEINTPLAYVRSTLETVETHIIHSPLREFVSAAEGLLQKMSTGTATDDELGQQFSLAMTALESLGGEGLVLLDEMGALIKDGLYGADQIKELVVNLRNFSRLDKARVAFFQVEEGIESALMLAKNEVKNRQLIKKYGSVPVVACSPSQINQVLLNILVNAVHATPEGSGIITVETFQNTEDTVSIRISDNGKGIEPEHLGKIFDPFFTTKEVGEGTGLGLSIVYKIIKEHGGEITVDSVVGQGTSFLITLPVQQKEMF